MNGQIYLGVNSCTGRPAAESPVGACCGAQEPGWRLARDKGGRLVALRFLLREMPLATLLVDRHRALDHGAAVIRVQPGSLPGVVQGESRANLPRIIGPRFTDS
jgi:hypothetical protein